MSSSDLAHLVSRVLQVILVIVVAKGAQVVFDLARKLRKPCDLPVLNLDGWNFDQAKDRYIKDLRQYVKRARDESPDQVIQLYGPEGYVVVVPEQFVHELKALREDVQDNLPLWTDVLSDYICIDIKLGPALRKMISTKLNSKLDELFPPMVDEVRYSITQGIPYSKDWQAVNVNEKLLRIVSLISGRIFVGPPWNRDEAWIQANNDYTELTYAVGVILKKMWYITKIFTVTFQTIPEIRRLYECNKYAHKLFTPEIKRREQILKQDPKAVLPKDSITWVMEVSATEVPRPTYEQQAEMQLILSMAAIHTSRSTITNALYDLVAHPEYIEPLRREIDEAWEASGGMDRIFGGKLILLDSFLKESQRMAPVGQLAFDRRVVTSKGVTLSNGLHLRRGAHIAVPVYEMGLDSKIWDNPTQFHGFRFSDKRRASPENANKFQFATNDPAHSLYFGYGNHDCPGRFFASMEIKLVIAFILRHYDIAAPAEWSERPKTLFWAQRMSPDPHAHIMMRERQS